MLIPEDILLNIGDKERDCEAHAMVKTGKLFARQILNNDFDITGTPELL